MFTVEDSRTYKLKAHIPGVENVRSRALMVDRFDPNGLRLDLLRRIAQSQARMVLGMLINTNVLCPYIQVL